MSPLTLALILGATGALAGGLSGGDNWEQGALMGGLLGAGAGYGGAAFFAPEAAALPAATSGLTSAGAYSGLPAYAMTGGTTTAGAGAGGALSAALGGGTATGAGTAAGSYGFRQGINDFMLANTVANPRTGMLAQLLNEPPQQQIPYRPMTPPILIPKKRIIGG